MPHPEVKSPLFRIFVVRFTTFIVEAQKESYKKAKELKEKFEAKKPS